MACYHLKRYAGGMQGTIGGRRLVLQLIRLGTDSCNWHCTASDPENAPVEMHSFLYLYGYKLTSAHVA